MKPSESHEQEGKEDACSKQSASLRNLDMHIAFKISLLLDIVVDQITRRFAQIAMDLPDGILQNQQAMQLSPKLSLPEAPSPH